MKKPTLVALLMIAFATALVPAVASAQSVCAYPAQWVWRGYWSCEYPARAYYAPPYYHPPYYGHYGGQGGRAYLHGGGHYGGGHGGGSGGHSGGGHGGHR